jgi:hypothetical protein
MSTLRRKGASGERGRPPRGCRARIGWLWQPGLRFRGGWFVGDLLC